MWWTRSACSPRRARRRDPASRPLHRAKRSAQILAGVLVWALGHARAILGAARGRYEVKSIRVDGGGRAASQAWAVVWLVLVLAPVVATGGEFEDRGSPAGADGVITRANLGPGEVWPLHIERGTFLCKGKAVFISDGPTAYPLNGAAQALTRADPKGRRPLEDIWLVDEKTLAGTRASGVKVKMIRMDISPVLSRGVAWCRSRH